MESLEKTAESPEKEAQSPERGAEYHSKDFEWEELRGEVEEDGSLRYHLSSSCALAADVVCSPVESEHWRSFHRRHSTARFFKERRYLIKEFPELISCNDGSKVLEIGCGNGSSIIPILRARESLVVYACDCSEEVIEKTKEFVAEKIGIVNRFRAFVLDFSVDEFPTWLFCSACQNSSKENNNENETKMGSLVSEENQCCVGGVDFITMIFTLSAIPLNKMPAVIQKCASILKPGGLILFRDYGLYDMTMLRFLQKQKVGFREYMRSDGTLSYFFSLDATRDLFCKAGFIEIELEYCCVRSINRRNGKEMRRVWVHGKFQKPLIS